jgi:DNA-binding response OmpR family regulator
MIFSGRLLAIDDNRDAAELVVRVARRCGYEARFLADHADLAPAINEWQPDVLTLDLCMPEADGISLFSVLQANKFSGDVIIISGQDDWLRKVAGRLAGVHGLRVVDDLAKPVDLQKLGELLTRLRSGHAPPPPGARTGAASIAG